MGNLSHLNVALSFLRQRFFKHCEHIAPNYNCIMYSVPCYECMPSPSYGGANLTYIQQVPCFLLCSLSQPGYQDSICMPPSRALNCVANICHVLFVLSSSPKEGGECSGASCFCSTFVWLLLSPHAELCICISKSKGTEMCPAIENAFISIRGIMAN